MISYNSIRQLNVSGFYNEFEIEEEVIAELEKMIEDGFEQEAIDILINDYLIMASQKYSNVMMEYLFQIDQGPFRERDIDKVSRNVSLLGIGLAAYLVNNVKGFSGLGYFDQIFERNDIKDKILKKNIINEVLGQFDNLINTTVGQTQSFILSSIRTLQREMLSENLLIKNAKLTGATLEAEIERFKESLKIKYPEIYRAMNQGNIMTITRFSEGVEKTRRYKVGYYIDLSTRTTLLNAERTANTIAALVNEEPVMEYYLVDPRKVKKDREICQDILNKKIGGLSILATTEEVGRALGIMTIDEAKSTPDFAMGPLCRHGVRRVGKQYLEYIKTLLGENNAG